MRVLIEGKKWIEIAIMNVPISCSSTKKILWENLLSSCHRLAILCKLRNVEIEHMYHDSLSWKCDPKQATKDWTLSFDLPSNEPELHQKYIDWQIVSYYSSSNSWRVDQHLLNNKHLNNSHSLWKIDLKEIWLSTWREKFIVDFLYTTVNIFLWSMKT